MQFDPGPLLIVAVSGRALAQSARRGGWRPWVIDGFADQDTRLAAERCLPVDLGPGGLDLRAVHGRLMEIPRGIGIVYGGGLEATPELVDTLAGHGRLYGNEAAALRAACEPEQFFGLLRAHGIPHPVTRRRGPQSEGWLRKCGRASGGAHVRPWFCSAGAAEDDSGSYFQRHVEGRPMSALFLADGVSARVIGFNRQWPAGDDRTAPFRYGGAVGRADMSRSDSALVENWASVLTRELRLRGLNGLDFIATEGGPLMIELNPRPPATGELYDADLRDGLVALHVQTCRDGLPECIPWQSAAVRAHGILYARRALRVPAGLPWPEWTGDIPPAGHAIAVGEPVCSVHAEAASALLARRTVGERQRAIWNQLCSARGTA